MRLLNILVIVALVFAAAYVYGIKFDLTQRIERIAKFRAEIRREREAIAALRAEWAKLDNPARVQGLAARHLRLRPLEAVQFDSLDRLPARPPAPIPEPADPIAALLEQPGDDMPTGSVPEESR